MPSPHAAYDQDVMSVMLRLMAACTAGVLGLLVSGGVFYAFSLFVTRLIDATVGVLPYFLGAVLLATAFLVPITTVLLFVIVWRDWSKNPNMGTCVHCGYDLIHRSTDVCPECGTEIPVWQLRFLHPDKPLT